MEEYGDQNVGNGGSRWNPTKEQIDMLEGFYKQGLRTPSAEQIHQITERLQAFGQIEGKNVFYWFQNHKARQRQKQKQENSTTYNYFYHPSPSSFLPHHNVHCSPYYMPKAETVMLYPKVPLPPVAGSFKRRLLPQSTEKNKPYTCVPRYNKPSSKNEEQETLELFPMHPTGILQAKNGFGGSGCETQSSYEIAGDHHQAMKDRHYFDLFSGKLN